MCPFHHCIRFLLLSIARLCHARVQALPAHEQSRAGIVSIISSSCACRQYCSDRLIIFSEYEQSPPRRLALSNLNRQSPRLCCSMSFVGPVSRWNPIEPNFPLHQFFVSDSFQHRIWHAPVLPVSENPCRFRVHADYGTEKLLSIVFYEFDRLPGKELRFLSLIRGVHSLGIHTFPVLQRIDKLAKFRPIFSYDFGYVPLQRCNKSFLQSIAWFIKRNCIIDFEFIRSHPGSFVEWKRTMQVYFKLSVVPIL